MITILLGTYNGERYIRAQLDSILNQTFKNFKIIIQDDCSTDGTLAILKEYERKYPNIITVKINKKNTGSPKHNFLDMLINNKDDYLMLCDQDDVWKRDKIEITLKEMKKIEKNCGDKKPILVHTDLTVVDENLNLIYKSFKKQMNANYGKTSLNNIIIQNTLTGCTAMINRALSELITKEPAYCVMHDWWIVLIASAFGVISGIDDQTILYRQHGHNEIGAGNIRSLKYKINRLMKNDRIKEAIKETYSQSENFLEMYRHQLSKHQIELLEKYIEIPYQNKSKKIKTIIKYKFYKNTLTRKIAHLLFI